MVQRLCVGRSKGKSTVFPINYLECFINYSSQQCFMGLDLNTGTYMHHHLIMLKLLTFPAFANIVISLLVIQFILFDE